MAPGGSKGGGGLRAVVGGAVVATLALLLMLALCPVSGENPSYKECQPHIDATIRNLAAKAIVAGETPSDDIQYDDYVMTEETQGETEPEVYVEPEPPKPVEPPMPPPEEPKVAPREPEEAKPDEPKVEPKEPTKPKPAEPKPQVVPEPAPPPVEKPKKVPAPPVVEKPAPAPRKEKERVPVYSKPEGPAPKPKKAPEPTDIINKIVDLIFGLPKTVREAKWATPWQTHPEFKKAKVEAAPAPKKVDTSGGIVHKFVSLFFGEPSGKRDSKWSQPWQTHKEHKKEKKVVVEEKKEVYGASGGFLDMFVKLVFPTVKEGTKRDPKWAEPWQTHPEFSRRTEEKVEKSTKKEVYGASGGLLDKFVKLVFPTVKEGTKRDPKWAQPWQTHPEFAGKGSLKEEPKEKKKTELHGASGGLLDMFVKLVFPTVKEGTKRDPKWAEPWQTHPEFSRKVVEKTEKPTKKEVYGASGGLLDKFVKLVFATVKEGTKKDPKWAEPWQTHPEFSGKAAKQEAAPAEKKIYGASGGIIDYLVSLVFEKPKTKQRDAKWAEPWQTHPEFSKGAPKAQPAPPPPAPKPKAEPAPTPKAEPAPAPRPKPTPAPKPEPVPAPKPEPAPAPKPEPAPAPKPEPAPAPKPEPAPAPKPKPVPTPKTEPPKPEPAAAKPGPPPAPPAEPKPAKKEPAEPTFPGEGVAGNEEDEEEGEEDTEDGQHGDTDTHDDDDDNNLNEEEIVDREGDTEGEDGDSEDDHDDEVPEGDTDDEDEEDGTESDDDDQGREERKEESDDDDEDIQEGKAKVESEDEEGDDEGTCESDDDTTEGQTDDDEGVSGDEDTDATTRPGARGRVDQGPSGSPAPAKAGAAPPPHVAQAPRQQVLEQEAPKTPPPPPPLPAEEEQIVVVPSAIRSRDRLEEILGLDVTSRDAAARTDPIADATLKELKTVYQSTITPLETLYKYQDISNRHVSDAELFGTPLVLLLGPYSTGKSSFINYLLGIEYTKRALKTGTPPSHGVFRVVQYGKTDAELGGTALSAHWSFTSLQKFGQNFVDQLHGRAMNVPLLKKVTFVEAPGILEMRRPGERLYPYNDVVQWFIDRADLILVMFDYTKLDAGYELEAVLDQLKGREAQTRILLNKADQVPAEELIKVQGSLFWNLSPLLGVSTPPTVYAGSFASRPYRSGSPAKLFQAQEEALLSDLANAINARVENRIAIARRHAVRVRNHAQMVDTYLTTFYRNKGFLTSKHKLAEDIIENPHTYNIYEGMSLLTNISRYDLPDPEVYRDFFRVHNLYDFQTLKATCSYFRGCPLSKIDEAISTDLPSLLERYRRLVEAALAAPAAKASRGGPVPAPPVRGSVPAAATARTS